MSLDQHSPVVFVNVGDYVAACIDLSQFVNVCSGRGG